MVREPTSVVVQIMTYTDKTSLPDIRCRCYAQLDKIEESE